MIEIVGPKDRKYFEGKRVLNVTSCSTDFCKALSPMILGPCDLYRGFVSKTVENGWQYSKVYTGYDDDGIPNMDYFKWAVSGWSNYRGVRYPMGKGVKPLYSFWNDECLDYIQARQKIYIPLYATAARKTSAFKTLKEMYDAGENIILFDFDGYISDDSMKSIILNPNRSLGHSFVIKMMLMDLI